MSDGDFIREAWDAKTQRQREQANALARAAIEAAERRTAEPAELEDRLRHAADAGGRLTIDAAIAAVKGEQPGASFSDQIRADHARAESRQARGAEDQLFSGEPEAEASTRPEGDADGGRGSGEVATYEETPHGRMRVWNINDQETTP